MDARLLEYFLRVVETGSISRAAKELHLSQPSLSRWLALLEHEVGTSLLVRSYRGVHPTDAGRQLVDRSQPILRQLNLLRDEIGRTAVSQVALGMPYALRTLITVPFLKRLAVVYPNYAIRAYEGMTHDIRTFIENGVVDVGVMVSSERSPEGYDTTPLLSEPLFLVGAESVGLETGAPVTTEKLRDIEIILPARPNLIRAQVEAAVEQAGGSYRGALDAETLTLCLELTAAGMGYTVMPASALHGQLGQGGGLSAAPIRDLSFTWSLCTNRARSYSVAVRSVSALLHDQVREQFGHHYAGDVEAPAYSALGPTVAPQHDI